MLNPHICHVIPKTTKQNIKLDTPGHIVSKSLIDLYSATRNDFPVGINHYEYAEQYPSLNQNKYYFRNKNDSFYLELLLEELKTDQYKLNR